MTFTEAVQSCFAKYVTFTGRALRSEFWYFVLFILLGGVVTNFIDIAILGTPEGGGPLTLIFSLGTFLPNIAVSVRRLHDIGKSGWFLLLVLIPLVGIILLIVWFARKGDERPNEYGPPQLSAPGR